MSDLIANWPAPPNVRALTTTRLSGASLAPYDANNLALHVGDDEKHVRQNRDELIRRLSLPNPPVWLNQTHTNECVIAEEDANRNADAAITRSALHPLVIMTADCLPILLCDRQGTEIAAIHAGWRGLLNGIVENTINKMHTNPDKLLAWIGPAICQQCYETGKDVQEAYINRHPFAKKAFVTHGSHVHASLPGLAELILQASGVANVSQSNACTFELEHFYSYRRQAQTGRMATLIWFNQE